MHKIRITFFTRRTTDTTTTDFWTFPLYTVMEDFFIVMEAQPLESQSVQVPHQPMESQPENVQSMEEDTAQPSTSGLNRVRLTLVHVKKILNTF